MSFISLPKPKTKFVLLCRIKDILSSKILLHRVYILLLLYINVFAPAVNTTNCKKSHVIC